MKKCIICFAIIFLYSSLLAQDWSAPGFFNHFIYRLEKDPDESSMYLLGLSQSVNEEIAIQGVARYNGSNFSTINGAVIAPPDFPIIPQHSSLKVFSESIYFYGKGAGTELLSTMEGDSVNNNYLKYEYDSWKKWDTDWNDGTQWNNRLTCMEIVDDELWLIPRKQHYYDSFRWARAQLDGSVNYFELQASENALVGEIKGYMRKIVKWGNDYYLIGRFYKVNPDQSSSTQVHILKWDGENNFEYLPQAFFYGLATSVSDVVVYQDKLVICGYFSESISGSPSNFIMTWDGYEWAPLFGNGTNGAVRRLQVIDGLLFFAGSFNLLHQDDGDYAASCIAYFDGTQAHRLSTDVIQGVLHDFIVFQDHLYIVGHIPSIQLQPFGNIARFEGELPAITNLPQSPGTINKITIYPNPCAELCFVGLPPNHRGGLLKWFDATGKHVFEQTIPQGTPEYQVRFSSRISRGMYHVLFHENEGHFYSSKCVVE